MSKTNIKGTAANALGYAGIVSLSQHIRGKRFTVAKIHNTGGKALFEFLADCLIGDFDIARLDRPNKILLLNKQDNGRLVKAGDIGFIYQLSKPEKLYSESESIVKYSFVIPQDVFAGISFNAIGLYTGTAENVDIENYAACCDIDPEVVNSLSVSSVLVLDWELHIANFRQES